MILPYHSILNNRIARPECRPADQLHAGATKTIDATTSRLSIVPIARKSDFALTALAKTKFLPFVCRLKDAKAGKSKQTVIEISNAAKLVNAK